MTKREKVEAEFPSSEGWMWQAEFAELVGVTQISSGTRSAGGKLFERAGTPRLYRYRVIGDVQPQQRAAQDGKKVYAFRPDPECAGCSVRLTKNRTHILAGVSICRTCVKRATIGGDLALCEKLGI